MKNSNKEDVLEKLKLLSELMITLPQPKTNKDIKKLEEIIKDINDLTSYLNSIIDSDKK
jgi:hypothetical protein